MHLLQAKAGAAVDETEAVDLGQTPGDIVFLSAADTELASLAAARARPSTAPFPRFGSRTSCTSPTRCRWTPTSNRWSPGRSSSSHACSGAAATGPTVSSSSSKPAGPLRSRSPSCPATINRTPSSWRSAAFPPRPPTACGSTACTRAPPIRATCSPSRRTSSAARASGGSRPPLPPRAGVYRPGTGVCSLEELASEWAAGAPLRRHRLLSRAPSRPPTSRLSTHSRTRSGHAA